MNDSFFIKSIDETFTDEAWEEDVADRYNLAELNASFHRSVPSLKAIQWNIEKVQRGYCECSLPLTYEGCNQYITHQAAIILVAADNTGGVALTTLFHRIPIIGFSPQKDDYGVYIWGAACSVKWLRPSSEEMTLKATVPKAVWHKNVEALRAGKAVIQKVRVKCYNGDLLCCVADFTYWCRDSRSLRDSAENEKSSSILYSHKIKTSARMIAGLRHLAADIGYGDLDPYAHEAASGQGIALATKMLKSSPQLLDMVALRTKHLDTMLSEFSDEPFTLVNIGTGFDARPWRLQGLNIERIYELDLPAMLELRERVMPPISESEYNIERIGINLLKEEVVKSIVASGYDPKSRTFVIWEGGSMYFNSADSDTIFKNIASLLNHPESRLWIDFVSQALVADETGHIEITRFLDTMRALGEPFITGYDDISTTMAEYNLEIVSQKTCRELNSSTAPVFDHYSFAQVRAIASWK